MACLPRDTPAKGAPKVVGTPSIVGTPFWVLGHGRALGAVDTDGIEGAVMPPSGVSALIAGTEELGLSATDGGLSPPPPSSVEPSGIPNGPIEPGEASGGDADAAQVPIALAVMPPPSNVALPDSPGVALAVPAVLVEPATPADAPVIGLAVVVELPVAADAGNAPTHGAPIKGAAPDVVGLTPGVASSVAPRGIPVCPTGALGTPSGDVMPKAGSGETLMRAWA